MLTVGDIMVREPFVVEPDVLVPEVLGVMLERGINSVVVCRGASVEGIFTPRDLLHGGGTAWERTAVSELMTPRPVTIGSAESYSAAEDVMHRLRIRHLPVLDAGRLVGIVSVRDLLEHRARYLEGVVARQTAELEAKNAALVDRDRVREYHLDLAGRIQRQVLPRTSPEFPPFSIAHAFHPLEKVSGDGYDFALLDDDHLGILIADASGHGVPAAFVSVMARAIFHAFGRRETAPSEVLRTMNHELPPLIEEQHFITMCFAVVERSTYRLTYASAGHPAPLWYHRQGDAVEPLDVHGHLIGVLDEPHFEDTTIQLRPGDAVLFYTDGVVECLGEGGAAFGTERAASALRSSARRGPAAIIERLEEELRRHARPSTQHPALLALADDATCIALVLAAE